ncbi:transcriptional regulator [Fictibacillus arsenicus]|uniref:L-aspartate dehydrogenase n=1 Tax=Fictibacillus arsenicus TaxID=255247 RepID=A0A1B1Z8N9_9BACL|nr:aspartate dehydrogenase [Fictibacillus arsenicus]ANX13827.1 transcriptional regulator [Fictibacillus arsenicus]
MLKVGLIGYGAIGKDLATYFDREHGLNAKITGILVRSPEKISIPPNERCVITNEEDTFFSLGLDVVVEAAGHQSVQQYGVMALAKGAHLVIVSVGALTDDELFSSLKEAAVASKKQLIIPSAAIAGLDRINAASNHTLEEVKLVSRKPPRAWYGTFVEEKVDLKTIKEPFCVFDGYARESAKLFPESVNVSAALSLAGMGFDQTKVQVFVDPTIEKNSHEVTAKGHFGEVSVKVQNTPLLDNPKSSYIVSMSIVKALKNLSAPVVIGV